MRDLPVLTLGAFFLIQFGLLWSTLMPRVAQATKAPVYFDEVRPLNAAHWATAAAAGSSSNGSAERRIQWLCIQPPF